MVSVTGRRGRAARDRALVWVDSREAFILRSTDGGPEPEHLLSDVPPRTRSIGHIRRDPTVRHGGGEAQDSLERRREGLLAAFLDEVERRLPADADLWLIGPGPVHEQLGRSVRSADARRRSGRHVVVEAAPRTTVPRLRARLREVAPKA